MRPSLSRLLPALALVTFVQAPIRPTGGILLRYKFKEGNVDRYAVDITATAGGTALGEDVPTVPSHGSGRVLLKVAKTNPDGSAIIIETREGFQFRGLPVVDEEQSSRYNVGPRGDTTLIGQRRAARFIFGDPTAMAKLTTYLPKQFVKQGDRWTSIALNPVTGHGNVESRGSFFKMERVDGVETARIHQAYTVPLTMDQYAPGSTKEAIKAGKATIIRSIGTMKISAAINFDPKAGRVVRSSVTGNGKFNLELPGKAKPKTKATSRPVKKNQKAPPPPEPEYKLKVEVISTLLR